MPPRRSHGEPIDSATSPPRLADRCRVCQAPIARWQARRYGNTCGNWRCRQVWLQELWRDREQARRREREASQRRWQCAATERDRLAALAGISPPSSLLPVPLPANVRALVPLPDARRETFRENLRQAIRAALESSDAPDDVFQPAPAPSGDPWPDVLSLACAVCQGHCCACGRDHAYISAETVRRYLADHPQCRGEDLFQAYDRCLKDPTFDQSCVYHQPDGCGLPRAMRSATCNTFECLEMREMQGRRSELRSAAGLLLVALDGDRPVRWSVV